jgi:amidase
MARTCEDLELGLKVLAGPNRWDHPAWRLELPPPRRRVLKDYRVAAWLDDPICRMQPEVGALLEKTSQTLASSGVTVDYSARPSFTLEKIFATFAALLQAALSGGVSFEQIEKYAAATGDAPPAQIKRLQTMRHRQWLSHNERRLQMRRQCEEFFKNWDALLLPVMPCAAILHDHSQPLASRTVAVGDERRPYWELNAWMAPAGACYLPATVIPVGSGANGLPIGIQIVGAYLEDRTTLDLGKYLLEMTGGCPRPAGF